MFFLSLAAAALFVWWSSDSLPALVASHFVSGGVAGGYTPRGDFVGFMLAMVLLVPAFIYSIGWLAARLPVRLVNLPNRQYWLAPERRADTVASLGKFGVWASYATLGLLCAVHGLVVHANAQHPPRLQQAPLIGLMAIYFIALFIGVVAVIGRFFRAH